MNLLSRCLTLSLIAISTLAAEEWKPLFNGKNLDGWTFDILDGSNAAEIFTVRDGLIDIHGAGKSKGVMQTVEKFDHFAISLEWRWPAKPGNSGCLLYCSTPRFLNIWPKSIEVQIESGNAGDLITIGEEIEVPEAQRLKVISEKEKWKVRLRPNLTNDSEHAPGEWNRMDIEAKDGVVTVRVNHVLVNRGTGATAKAGHICLQAEGADIQYRNVRIKSL